MAHLIIMPVVGPPHLTAAHTHPCFRLLLAPPPVLQMDTLISPVFRLTQFTICTFTARVMRVRVGDRVHSRSVVAVAARPLLGRAPIQPSLVEMTILSLPGSRR